MKIGILHRLSLEEASEEGLDTDATIDENDDTLDEPAEEAAGDDAEEESEGDEEEVDPADAPIEYPEIGNLEVDKVHDQLVEDEEARQERVEEALDATEQLTTAIESMRVAIAQSGTLSPDYARNAVIALKSIRTRLGFQSTESLVALEDYSAFQPTDAHLALEGFKETLASIFRAVLAAIQSALAWLSKAFVNFFFGIKQDLKLTQDLTDAILKLRGNDKDGRLKTHRDQSASDDQHYVSLPENKRILTLMGKQPGEYEVPEIDNNGTPTGNKLRPYWPEALSGILLLAKQHTVYQKHISQALVDEIGEYFIAAVTATATNQPAQLKPFVFSPISLTPSGFYNSGPVAPVPNVRGCAFAVNDFFLGSFKVITRCSLKTPMEATDSLENIADWHSQVVPANVPSMDGWMRFVPSDELKAASEVVMSIEHELMACEKTVDKVRDVEEKLKKMALETADLLAKVPTDFMDPKSANGWRGAHLTTGLRAVNSIVANVNRSLYEYSGRSRMCCRAWNDYLNQIYLKEKKLLSR